MAYEDRHPSTQHLVRFCEYGHLPAHLQPVSQAVHDTMQDVVDLVPGPELTAGLRKLLEAKDCFVRAAVDEMRKED